MTKVLTKEQIIEAAKNCNMSTKYSSRIFKFLDEIGYNSMVEELNKPKDQNEIDVPKLLKEERLAIKKELGLVYNKISDYSVDATAILGAYMNRLG